MARTQTSSPQSAPKHSHKRSEHICPQAGWEVGGRRSTAAPLRGSAKAIAPPMPLCPRVGAASGAAWMRASTHGLNPDASRADASFPRVGTSRAGSAHCASTEATISAEVSRSPPARAPRFARAPYMRAVASAVTKLVDDGSWNRISGQSFSTGQSGTKAKLRWPEVLQALHQVGRGHSRTRAATLPS